MAKLLIIADDLTGSLDAGVQLSRLGIRTVVAMSASLDQAFAEAEEAGALVVNTESRHLPRDEAYGRVYRAARAAVEHGVRTIYKKTDSTLRGKIGAELQAVWDATG